VRGIAYQEDPAISVAVHDQYARCPGIRSQHLGVDSLADEPMDEGQRVGLTDLGRHAVGNDTNLFGPGKWPE